MSQPKEISPRTYLHFLQNINETIVKLSSDIAHSHILLEAMKSEDFESIEGPAIYDEITDLNYKIDKELTTVLMSRLILMKEFTKKVIKDMNSYPRNSKAKSVPLARRSNSRKTRRVKSI
jgi:hypothetical protein